MKIKMYYVYDVEGMEPPEGPYTLNEAYSQLTLKDGDWNVMDEDTAKQVYTYLNEDHL
jgi:hypothetical protein